MTALHGFWSHDGRHKAVEQCRRMQSALRIYGPDRQACWDGGSVALGSALMRVLPEDRFDRQPLRTENRRFVLVADARLDNRPELIADLDLPGDASGLADADILLAAWQAWGEDSPPRLIGDFAFAVWDDRDRRLFLIRDYPGMRPLFYHAGAGWIAFASMAKGLHSLPDVPRAVNREMLWRQLLQVPFSAGEATYFAGISRVEPGGMTVVEADGRLRSRMWYTPPARCLLDRKDPAEYVGQVRAVFSRAVSDRLRGNGDIAAELSGGLDSSATVATAAGLLSAAGRRLTAYTAVPATPVPPSHDGEITDEGDLAAQLVSRYPWVDHVRFPTGEGNLPDALNALSHYAEMPALTPANLCWLLGIPRQAAAAGQRIMLSSTWGNMTISEAGEQALNGWLYGGHLWQWLKEVVALRRAGRRSLRSLALTSILPLLGSDQEQVLRDRLGRIGFPLEDNGCWHDRDLPLLRRLYAEGQSDPPVRKIPRDRVARVLQIFRQQELMTLMRKGILAQYRVDCRDPTADRRLIDLILALPDTLFLRNGQFKWLYHQVFNGVVPDGVRLNTRSGKQAADWRQALIPQQAVLQASVAAMMRSQGDRCPVDLQTLSALAETLPEAEDPSFTAVRTYRLKFLRSYAVAYFVQRIQGGNG